LVIIFLPLFFSNSNAYRKKTEKRGEEKERREEREKDREREREDK
jgi:hypothetical protein